MRQDRTSVLVSLSEADLADGLARTPSDQFVIWNGVPSPGREGSIRRQSLGLIHEIWEPVPLRTLVLRAARLAGSLGLSPDAVRSAVRMHQTSSRASYILVRRTAAGDFVAVTDVPTPSFGPPRVKAGDVVLGRTGRRLDGGEGRGSAPPPRAGIKCAVWKKDIQHNGTA